MVSEQRRGRDGRGDRDGHAVRQPRGDDSHRPRARGQQLVCRAAQDALQRETEREDARNSGERELPAGVGPCARIPSERGGCRQQQGIRARGGARGRHRGDPGQPHHPGPLQRGAGSGQRDVERDQAGENRQPHAQPDTGKHEEGQRQRHEQHHILARHGEQMCQAAGAKVLPDALADPLVLAEHHAAQQRRVIRRHSGADRSLGARASTIEQAGHSSAPSPREPRALEHELARDTAPAQMGGEVEAAWPVAGTLPEGGQSTLERELRPGLGRSRQRRPARDPQQQPRPVQAAAHHRNLRGGAELACARSGEQLGAKIDGLPVSHSTRGAVDRMDPQLANGARPRAPARRRSRRVAAPRPRRPEEEHESPDAAGSRQRELRPRLGERQPKCQGGDRDMERPLAGRGETGASGKRRADVAMGGSRPTGLALAGAFVHLTAAPLRAGSRSAFRRSPRPRVAPLSIGILRSLSGTRRSAPRASDRCRPARRADLPSPCPG